MQSLAAANDAQAAVVQPAGLLADVDAHVDQRPGASRGAQAVVESQMRRHSPRILRIQRYALDVLRKTAIAGRRARRAGSVIDAELRRIRYVVGWILREGVQGFRVPRKSPAQHRLVNEVDPEPKRVIPGRMPDVITKLVLLLIPQIREMR